MSLDVNGAIISIAAYRALQIDDFLKSRNSFDQKYCDVEADKLLHLVAQLLPGDGVTATLLEKNDIRRKALYGNDFTGAVVDLLKAFTESFDFTRLTEGKEDLLRRPGASGITTARVIERENA